MPETKCLKRAAFGPTQRPRPASPEALWAARTVRSASRPSAQGALAPRGDSASHDKMPMRPAIWRGAARVRRARVAGGDRLCGRATRPSPLPRSHADDAAARRGEGVRGQDLRVSAADYDRGKSLRRAERLLGPAGAPRRALLRVPRPPRRPRAPALILVGVDRHRVRDTNKSA